MNDLLLFRVLKDLLLQFPLPAHVPVLGGTLLLYEAVNEILLSNDLAFNCVVDNLVITVLLSGLELITIGRVHLLKHASHVVVEFLEAVILFASVVHNLNLVAVILKLLIVAILITSSINIAANVTAKAQTLDHGLRVVGAVCFRKLISHASPKALHIVHVVLLNDIFGAEVQLLLVARENTGGSRSVCSFGVVIVIVLDRLLPIWVLGVLRCIIIIKVVRHQLTMPREVPILGIFTALRPL